MELRSARATRVIVASTVMLSFISFWRAAAIVLNDLASSAYYAPGVAEQAIGKSAPWFILAVMLFSYAVRAVYVESCSMFTRGGVYKVVKEAMGGWLAKFSVSALLFDYILTGPVSGVSAGQYLVGLINDTSEHFGHPLRLPENLTAALFAVVVIVYFWRKNILGIHESSTKAMQIMKLTTVMVVIMIGWALLTLAHVGIHVPPLPTHQNIVFGAHALGWLHGSFFARITLVMLLVGFGHSVLAMSGEETLAQVNRELEHPKLKNLKRAGMVIFIYSLVFTSLVGFFAVMIIPDAVRPHYIDNLISGLSMYFVGPISLRLAFQAFVVVVGILILAGAVNTAIIGSNGVLQRVSEDGVLTGWFRHPHEKYGTSHRLIHLIVVMQILTIVLSRGDMTTLGEAYAFGVVWSFAMKALAVLVLRFRQAGKQEWKVPLNLHLGRLELPIGLGLITLLLFATAIVNLFTKPMATIGGILFTATLFITFTVSERINHHQHHDADLDQFRVSGQDEISLDGVGARPGSVLVAVRDYHSLGHLRRVLQRTNTSRQDIVVVTIRMMGAGEYGVDGAVAVNDYEQRLFTQVVAEAEKAGKPVSLLVVPGGNPFDALVQTASRLRCDTIVAGRSRQLPVREQGNYTGLAWEQLPEPRPRLRLEVLDGDSMEEVFYLGPHEPRLREKDVALMHEVWLDLVRDPRYRELHHYHVVSLALKRLKQDLASAEREEVIAGFRLKGPETSMPELAEPETVG